MLRIKVMVLIVMAIIMTMATIPALGHSYDRYDSDYWLRYVSYVVHPLGVAVEYALLRPIHWLVSRPHVCWVCGHEPHKSDVYFEWKRLPDDFETR